MARALAVPLNAKLLGAFLLVLLPMLILLLVGIDDRRRSSEESLVDGLLLTSQAVSLQVDETFDAAISTGWAVANDPLVQTMDPMVLDSHLTTLVSRTPEYWTIAVFNAEGVCRGWGNLSEPAEPRLDISRDAHFRRVMATNQPTISSVQQLDRPPTLGFVAATPIRDADSRVVGVVTIVIRTDQLARKYLATQRQPGQAIFAIDPEGRIAFHTLIPDLTPENSRAFTDFAPVRSALAGITTVDTDFVSPFFGDRRLGAFTPTLYRWAVGVTIPREIALAPIERSLRDQLTAFALIVLLSALLATALSRLLTQPIRWLDDAATALGHGDLSRRVRVGPGDEIGHLGESFNEMADRLENRQAEIVQLRAEAERRANQLAAVIASMTDAVFVVSPEGRLVDANPAALNYFGRPSPRDIGETIPEVRSLLQMRHADGRPLIDDEVPIYRALRGEAFANVDLLVRDAAGEDRFVSASGAPVRDEAGDVVLAVVVIRDVTEQHRSEEERARLLERERALFAITRALLREIELERVVETAIERSAAILGADMSIVYLADPDRRELKLLAHRGLSAESILQLSRMPYDTPLPSPRAAKTGQVQIVADMRSPESSELSRDFSAREGVTSVLSIPLLRRGYVVGVMALFYRQRREIAESDLDLAATLGQLYAVAIENAQLFEQVRGALRLREEFMATAAHELKTPITVILGYAGTLLRLHQNRDLTQRGLEAIDRQAKRIAHLIEDLLAVVRIRPGISALKRERFDLAALVRARVRGRDFDGTHQIALEEDGALPVSADSGLIAEALDHLLENAVRYSPAGGRIEVSTGREPSGRDAIVAVRDYGYSIPPDRQPHVFEPFYESIPSGAPGYLGIVSLGLYLSKQIVDAHGGRIWLRTESDGSTVFSFTLPLAE